MASECVCGVFGHRKKNIDTLHKQTKLSLWMLLLHISATECNHPKPNIQNVFISDEIWFACACMCARSECECRTIDSHVIHNSSGDITWYPKIDNKIQFACLFSLDAAREGGVLMFAACLFVFMFMLGCWALAKSESLLRAAWTGDYAWCILCRIQIGEWSGN